MDYGNDLQFGLSIDPTAQDLPAQLRLAHQAETLGLDILAVQDHAYHPGFIDALVLLTVLATQTERIRLTSNVASLALRPAPMLAKTATSIDLVSGGRFALGVGVGTPNATAMGGIPVRDKKVLAFAKEAIGILRNGLDGKPTRVESDHFHIEGYQPGPITAHHVPLWIGANSPGMTRMVGKLADGWLSPLGAYMPFSVVPERQKLIDEGARQAGRKPSDIRRILNISGVIADASGVSETPLDTLHTIGDWIAALADLTTEYGFDSYIFWPQGDAAQQLNIYATKVLPAVRQEVARRRQAATA